MKLLLSFSLRFAKFVAAPSLLLLMGATCRAESISPAIESFLTKRCADCHNAATREGGLDLGSLSRDLNDPAAEQKWVRIHDRVLAGEMPPADVEVLDDGEKMSLTQSLAGVLATAHSAHKGTVLRRLNRQEYENTLNDLFGTHLNLAEQLPEDGRSHEFDTIGAALSLSAVQLQRYLDAIELVIETVHRAPPKSRTVTASFATSRDAQNFLGKQWHKLSDGSVALYKDWGYPDGMLREASTDQPGWYRVRITGYAHQSEQPISFGVGAKTYARGAGEPMFGYYSFGPGSPTQAGSAQTVELRTWIEKGYMITLTPQGLYDRGGKLKSDGIENYRGPGLAVLNVELEGPIEDHTDRGRRLLYDGLNRREIEPKNPRDQQNPRYIPRYEILSENPAVEVTPVLSRIATRAFRRDVSASEIEPYRRLFLDEMALGSTFEESLKTAVMAIFCSPDFLYLKEPAGQLDDAALAARLSYFLTRTQPDDQLQSAVATGELTANRAALRTHAIRLLESEKSDNFVNDFTDAWLNLREIERTSPDNQLFPEFDRYLQYSMVAETRLYFRELVEENLNAAQIVKSDFAMLNDRLAEHYGVPEVAGPELRRVALPADSVRGGLLSQGSILKVSANGTNTSPVVRGVWVMERILGQAPSPPPPGIPGVEPDIRGATTLRELLEKHRDNETCAACHNSIDPPGFALESFNPIGGYRERFRSLGGGDRVDDEVLGRKVRYKLGPTVDATGTLPDGRSFDGFHEFRDLLAEDRETLARSLVTKFLAFATGREMGFSDRTEIDAIVRRSASDGFGVRDLLLAAVDSEIFRTK